jgi:hypothetical protein
MSAAMRHPGETYRVSPRHRPSLITWTSSGTISLEADTRRQTPMSIASRLTIQRR